VSPVSPPTPPLHPPVSPASGEAAGDRQPEHVGMARYLLLGAVVANMLIVAAPAAAHGARARQAHGALGAGRPTPRPTTNPIALAVKLAERYWRGVPACGTPQVLISRRQLPNADYEASSGPEANDTVVEMWTEVQKCTITINASVWDGWRQDDEFFQWFCDAMTHEVGHLFGHLDSGQTDAASITYPFLDGSSPNFDSVGECRDITLQYGPEQIRNETVVGARGH
jgi:hypothetical protein